jgi:NAD(P)-dependent dehydrogenase (short-subunit alcohol dehydrogenase family)
MGANSVRAGPIVTRMTESTRVDPEQYEFNPERVPQGRSGEPMEIADGELVIDDGITAR